MKKGVKLLTAIVVLGAVYTGTSWYVGKEAQATIEQMVQRANDRLTAALGVNVPESGVKVAISEYKRHVFSSDVVYTLQMRDSQGAPVEYLLSDHLQHGPFPLGALQSGYFAPLMALSHAQMIPSAATQKWFDSLQGQSPVVATTRVTFSGEGSSVWQLKPLDVKEGGDSLKFSGGVINATLSNNFQDSVVKGAFEALEYASARSGDSVQIHGIVLGSTTNVAGEPSTVKSSSQAVAEHFTLASADSVPVQLSKVAINLDSQQRNNQLEGALQYSLGSIRLGEADFGSLTAGFKGSNLDVQALTDLVVTYDRIKALHNLGPNDELELTPDEAVQLRNKLWAVLASQPTVSIDPFTWKNSKGESTLKLAVNLARPAGADASEAGLLLPQIVKRLELNLAIAKPMFIQTFSQFQGVPGGNGNTAMMGAMVFDMYAARLGRAGLAVQTDDKLSTGIRYENDSVEVNGKAMSVPEFLQRAISAVM